MLEGPGKVASRASLEASIPSMVVSSPGMVVSSPGIVVRNPGIKPMGKSKHIALVMGKA